ncbi:PREDICTED: peroxisomal membrane protein PEX13 [Diuraphis noxia]|uniref:peroxisomal membrane protein PEX13 n=1 Tax=Diuraphis noxia TaxID=143948 RepID=UPI0007637EB5|nr:PREDICTED: peroxisomal membrane protein PEX13 [Diuraphis noxia]
MNDDELASLELNNISQKSPQLLQNIPTGAVGPGRVAPPMTTTATHPPNTSPNHPLNLNGQIIQRRGVPTQYTIPNNINNTYGGAFNNYPYRGMTNMNMGGFNPYNMYGQPTNLTNNTHQNPFVIAALENSRPAFDSIHSVVESFNSVSMMLESTFTAIHTCFQALLSVAENFTRLKSFMMKFYSTIVSFKLVRWFLTKLFYLLKMVRRDRGSSTEEDLWTALSSKNNHKEIISSDGRSWPLVVFTGLLVSTPYLVYKLLNPTTPESGSIVNNTLSSNTSITIAQCDWNSTDANTIPLVKGKSYFTSQENIASAEKTGWLLVASNGQHGYAPLMGFKEFKTDNRSSKSQIQDSMANVSFDPIPSNSLEQMQPKLSTPVTDVHGNPIALPHPLVDSDKSNIGKQ